MITLNVNYNGSRSLRGRFRLAKISSEGIGRFPRFWFERCYSRIEYSQETVMGANGEMVPVAVLKMYPFRARSPFTARVNSNGFVAFITESQYLRSTVNIRGQVR